MDAHTKDGRSDIERWIQKTTAAPTSAMRSGVTTNDSPNVKTS